MKQFGKILFYTAALTAVAGAVAVVTVPAVREQALRAKDQFMDNFRQREAELIEALSSTDAEVASARAHRAQKSVKAQHSADESFEF